MKKHTWGSLAAGLCLVAAAGMWLMACGPTIETHEREVSPAGNTTYAASKTNGEIESELRRVFNTVQVVGEGIFENANEGLARSTATDLAMAELAKLVQAKVQSDSTIYNQTDVRQVIMNQVNAIISNSKIEMAGYDPGTKKYRVRVSVTSESLVREIMTRIKR